MSELTCTKLAQQAYENFKTGDIPALLGLLSDEVEWQIPAMEGVPVAGTRRGPAQVAEFFATVASSQEALQFEPQAFIEQGDKVVALGHYVWRIKATGREFESDWAHVFTVRDGKIVRFQEYADTAAEMAAYQAA